jgi:hypothetical protein
MHSIVGADYLNAFHLLSLTCLSQNGYETKRPDVYENYEGNMQVTNMTTYEMPKYSTKNHIK